MTAPDTNTPRDGLTDAAIDRAILRVLHNGRHSGEMSYLHEVCRSAIAADREARPAPASVEALRVEAKRLAREVRIKLTNQCVNPSQKNVRACDAADAALADCIDRLAAASTPPAEAQPAESKRSTDAWNKVRAEARTLAPGRGLGDLLTAVLEFGAAQAADPHARFLYGDDATPPASEARATGDAAAYGSVADRAEKGKDAGQWGAATGAAGEPQPREGWKPIETAPRDGTAVLGSLPDSDIPQPIRYHADASCWQHAWDHHRLRALDAPTHWMPLPAAPAGDGSATVAVAEDVEPRHDMLYADFVARINAPREGSTLPDCMAQLILKHGGVRPLARAANLDHGYVSRLHTGEKDEPSPETLAALGIRRVVSYTLAAVPQADSGAAGGQGDAGAIVRGEPWLKADEVRDRLEGGE